MCCQYTQLHAGNETHCPIRTKYIPNFLYHFRLLGIFGTNTGYTLITLIPVSDTYTPLYILLGVGFGWVFNFPEARL
jgi:hypothetical protein